VEAVGENVHRDRGGSEYGYGCADIAVRERQAADGSQRIATGCIAIVDEFGRSEQQARNQPVRHSASFIGDDHQCTLGDVPNDWCAAPQRYSAVEFSVNSAGRWKRSYAQHNVDRVGTGRCAANGADGKCAGRRTIRSQRLSAERVAGRHAAKWQRRGDNSCGPLWKLRLDCIPVIRPACFRASCGNTTEPSIS